jgi:hypothetical protein
MAFLLYILLGKKQFLMMRGEERTIGKTSWSCNSQLDSKSILSLVSLKFLMMLNFLNIYMGKFAYINRFSI